MTATIDSIFDSINDLLIEESNSKINKKITSRLYPSVDAYGCFRMLVCNKCGLPKENKYPHAEISAALGRAIHSKMEELIAKGDFEGVEVEYKFENPELNIGGRADLVGPDFIMDWKLVASRYYKDYQTPNPKYPPKGYIAELMVYMHFLNKPNGALIFINRDEPKERFKYRVSYNQQFAEFILTRMTYLHNLLEFIISKVGTALPPLEERYELVKEFLPAPEPDQDTCVICGYEQFCPYRNKKLK